MGVRWGGGWGDGEWLGWGWGEFGDGSFRVDKLITAMLTYYIVFLGSSFICKLKLNYQLYCVIYYANYA